MTQPTGRKRGRPSKAEVAARQAAIAESAAKSDAEDSFLNAKLAEPVAIRRNTILQPEDDTLRTISELAKLFCTQKEIAAVLGVSDRTLKSFLADNPVARDVWEDGLQYAKVSLRRKQLSLSDKNAAAAIFLGKNYLGQKDEHHTNMTVSKPANEMTEDQLLEIASRGAPSKPKPEADKKVVH
jgi:hypothetical protein